MEINTPHNVSDAELKECLLRNSPLFWAELTRRSKISNDTSEFLFLSKLRREAIRRKVPGLDPEIKSIRIALVGGYTLYPLHELVEQALFCAGYQAECFVGEYDNYAQEILDSTSRLHEARPEIVVLFPSERRCRYAGKLTDSTEKQRDAVLTVAEEVLQLCQRTHDHSQAAVILANFLPPFRNDLGSYRTRTLASDWNFRRLVNIELGLRAAPHTTVCDLEFLSARFGAIKTRDERAWFETKQMGSPEFLLAVAREVTVLTQQLREASKKVLALDLDNTLWGGIVGDDGIDGIEIGDTSPRGEAFKAFQRYIKTLKERGVLLAVVSKNTEENALNAFREHPEMVLKLEDFVAFKANWSPKPDNLKAIAAELNLGVDSFVFVDDTAGEIEMMNQSLPQVATLHLSEDPAEHVGRLQDCRFFDPRDLTEEDGIRTTAYLADKKRKGLEGSCVDMAGYLKALEMKAHLSPFTPADIPRISQLINKSNQFNVTTIRRTPAEITELLKKPGIQAFTVRLSDKFGDHGLISVAIGKISGSIIEIDTWIMSCRVLQRGVESLVLNEWVRIASAHGVKELIGTFLPTKKNGLVAQLFPSLGFKPVSNKQGVFLLQIQGFIPKEIAIQVERPEMEPAPRLAAGRG